MSENFEPCYKRSATDRICPYCGYSYQVESEDIGEQVREEECGECGETFEFWAEISVDHITRKKEDKR
jgi:predicted Zn finger-like uncharacterized protein